MTGGLGRFTLVAMLSPGLAASARAFAEEPARGARLERFEWGKEVDGDAPIRAVEIRNDFGDIRARFTDDRRLAASAIIQRLDHGPQGVGVSVERRGPVVAITVAYPTGHVQDSDPNPPKDSFDRLDLTIFVPAGVALGAETLRGMVEARGLKSDVSARTLAGSISVATTGAVRARTASGEVKAILSPAPDVLRLEFESESGPISVALPAAADLEIHAESAGAVTGDFRLKKRRVGARTRAEATLGKGRRRLEVFSDTGALTFTRLSGPPDTDE